MQKNEITTIRQVVKYQSSSIKQINKPHVFPVCRQFKATKQTINVSNKIKVIQITNKNITIIQKKKNRT